LVNADWATLHSATAQSELLKQRKVNLGVKLLDLLREQEDPFFPCTNIAFHALILRSLKGKADLVSVQTLLAEEET